MAEIEATVTMDGKFQANIIPYSIEYEKTVVDQKDKPS